MLCVLPFVGNIIIPPTQLSNYIYNTWISNKENKITFYILELLIIYIVRPNYVNNFILNFMCFCLPSNGGRKCKLPPKIKVKSKINKK